MSKYLAVETEEGDWEIWHDEGDEENVTLVATVYDEDLAKEIVGLLIKNNPEDEDDYYDDPEDEEDESGYGKEVDDFLRENDYSRIPEEE